MTYGLIGDEAVMAKLGQMRLSVGDREVSNVKNALRARLVSLGNKFPVMLDDAEVEYGDSRRQKA